MITFCYAHATEEYALYIYINLVENEFLSGHRLRVASVVFFYLSICYTRCTRAILELIFLSVNKKERELCEAFCQSSSEDEA